MARTINTTSPPFGGGLIFLVAVDVDSPSSLNDIKCYKAVSDASDTDSGHTAAVDADMVPESSMTVGTTSYQGKTLPYFGTGASASTKITFGTNKPVVRTATDTAYTMFVIIGNMNNVPAADAQLTDGTGTYAGIGITESSGRRLCGTFGVSNFGFGDTIVTSGTQCTYAVYVKSTNTAGTIKNYFGADGGSLALDDDGTKTTTGQTITGTISAIGYNGTVGGFNWNIIAVGAFRDTYSDANRLTELQALHADPFAYLFQATSSASPLMGRNRTLSGGMQSLSGGV